MKSESAIDVWDDDKKNRKTISKISKANIIPRPLKFTFSKAETFPLLNLPKIIPNNIASINKLTPHFNFIIIHLLLKVRTNINNPITKADE